MADINVDQFAMALMRELEIYAANTVEDVKYSVKVVAREAAAELRDTSPRDTGSYAKSWNYRRHPGAGADYHGMVVYSRPPNCFKTHLLEDGHYTVNGNFVAARPHIGPVEKKVPLWLEDMLTKNRGR